MALRARPKDADLRERTLELGRIYSDMTRNMPDTVVFGEAALMNDIEAACAHAASIHDASGALAVSQSIEERLAKLADLKAKRLIDDDDYRIQKQRILDEV